MTFKNLRNGLILYILSIVIIWLFAMVLTSCSASRKIKSSEFKKIDTTSVSSSVEMSEKKKDSGAVKIKDSCSQNNIALIFDTEDPKEQANDLAGSEFKNDDIKAAYKQNTTTSKSYTYKINGNTIETPQRLQSANINISGKTSSIDLTNVNSSENNLSQRHDSTSKKEENKSLNKDKKTTGASILIWIGGIAFIFLFIYFGGGPKFIALLKRKKDDEKPYGNFKVPGS